MKNGIFKSRKKEMGEEKLERYRMCMLIEYGPQKTKPKDIASSFFR